MISLDRMQFEKVSERCVIRLKINLDCSKECSDIYNLKVLFSISLHNVHVIVVEYMYYSTFFYNVAAAPKSVWDSWDYTYVVGVIVPEGTTIK